MEANIYLAETDVTEEAEEVFCFKFLGHVGYLGFFGFLSEYSSPAPRTKAAVKHWYPSPGGTFGNAQWKWSWTPEGVHGEPVKDGAGIDLLLLFAHEEE